VKNPQVLGGWNSEQVRLYIAKKIAMGASAKMNFLKKIPQ
jgi:hypothetical protein